MDYAANAQLLDSVIPSETMISYCKMLKVVHTCPSFVQPNKLVEKLIRDTLMDIDLNGKFDLTRTWMEKEEIWIWRSANVCPGYQFPTQSIRE